MVSDLTENQLVFLTESVKKVRKLVNQLLGGEKSKPPGKLPGDQTVVDNSGKPGLIRRFFSSLTTPKPLPQATESDVLADRLKEIKEAITGIRTDLTIVLKLKTESERAAAAKATQNATEEDFGYPTGEDSEAETTADILEDDFRTMRSSVDEDVPVAAKSVAGQPTIIRRRSSAIKESDIIGLYNQAVTDNVARERFRERHQPVRVGTVNAVERRQNPTATIKPEFKETTDGDFFAFPKSGGNQYEVFPRLGLTIGPVSYNAGALGEMFGNPAYDPSRSYSRYQVRKPAIFKRDGDCWVLKSPGELDLGLGD
ncbi:MAG: hypothetical protein H7Z16_13600 [Pyrinomonadaceae bacterium]|nr:hypothetical protein [Pyrinomonadaceae bacterium]